MKVNNYEVGKRIKSIRIKLGKTTADFGSLIDGTSGSLVSRWERGVNLPNSKRLSMIAELGNITIDELLYGDFKARIKKVLSNKDEVDDNFIEIISNHFINLDNMNPTEEEVSNKYDEVNEMVNNMSEKKANELVLAINIRLAEELLFRFIADPSKDKELLSIQQAINKLAEATENYEVLFNKPVDEIYNEYITEEKD